MISYRIEPAWAVVSLVVGFFLALAALLSLSGYLLAIVFALGLLLASLGVAIAAWGKGAIALARTIHRRAEVPRPAELPQVAGTAQARDFPVVAKLIEVSGFCANTIHYAVGDEFTFLEGSRNPTSQMCAPALQGLLLSVDKLRAGIDGHEARIECPLSDSIMVFELRPKEPVH